MPPDDSAGRRVDRRPRHGSLPEVFRAEVIDDAYGRPVVVVAGEVDMASADELWARIEEALRKDARLVLDLQDTSFMDSTGLSALARACHATGQIDEAVVLRSPQPAVLHVLQASGIDQVVTIERS